MMIQHGILGYLILRKKPKWKEPKEFGASAVSPREKNETMNIDTFHPLCLGTSAIVAFEHAFREMTLNALQVQTWLESNKIVDCH